MLPLAVQNKNIFRLAAAQALAGANSVVFYATGAIVGNAIAPSPSLATLPITLFVLGMAASILPFGALGRTRGRKAAFRLGTGAGMVTGLAAALAVVLNSFLLFCLAAMLGGAYAAVALSFRFAATDGVAPARRARALSLVMGGGVAAGIIRPDAGHRHHAPLAGTYLRRHLPRSGAGCSAGRLFVERGDAGGAHRGQRARRAVAARDCPPAGFCHYGIQRRGGLYGDEFSDDRRAALHAYARSFPAGRQPWDPVACDGDVRPGFFTGRLIQRFGAVRMAAAGLLITAASVAVGLSGLGVYHYWLSLILLGIGWNFGFTGASAKIIDFHRPEEKTQVQSLNDFLVFGVMIVGSFSSGVLLNAFGWNAVLWGSLVPVAVALLTLLLRPLSPSRA